MLVKYTTTTAAVIALNGRQRLTEWEKQNFKAEEKLAMPDQKAGAAAAAAAPHRRRTKCFLLPTDDGQHQQQLLQKLAPCRRQQQVRNILLAMGRSWTGFFLSLSLSSISSILHILHTFRIQIAQLFLNEFLFEFLFSSNVM